ncbi:MAG: hypothetical protein EAZ98_15580 [Oscillatoriales cyanobacterium]|uniref:Uncharacterized protein n=1 Tax=Microcoleus anatoxicus PTRS2 TaxID=2705321 RepID=A0ABU8YHF0_9CYAN|nr:MAG: hypothetical protein EA000_25830 [Oscillatoriales cyanobacterium]TAD95471.1 MAG: hypothetical protein EAZ98_15580 [Oscillatoriales cyanobacterium]TAE04426.1 MAG: hypothetical protein EAZ96_09245 [Oscillatoriales cyanobacterium]TAF64139.1 MAG: hypothetical protein EAZ59_19160 [Oscillatoriales cyanobacterium]
MLSRKKEEGRRKKEEGRRKKEEGRRKKALRLRWLNRFRKKEEVTPPYPPQGGKFRKKWPPQGGKFRKKEGKN